MKKLLLAIATIGLTLSVFGQGAVIINNTTAVGGVAVQVPGNYYTGPYGLELWMKNGTAADATINSLNGVVGHQSEAYQLLTADGFTLQTHISGLTMRDGYISGIGEVDMPDVKPPGANVVLALAVWAGSGDSFYGPDDHDSGICTFVNPTSDYTIPPPDTPIAPGLDGWTTDLVFVRIPEPGVFALAGLGAAVVLVFRRGKQWTN